MSKINRVPRGLQDILGNTAQGVNPAELRQEVMPSLDMLPLWLVEKTEWTRFVGSFAATFQQNTIQVPAGEMWIPFAISGEAVTEAPGASVVHSVGYSDEPNTSRVHLGTSQAYLATENSESSICTYTWSQVQLVTADQFFFHYCQRLDNDGDVSAAFVLRFARVKI